MSSRLPSKNHSNIWTWIFLGLGMAGFISMHYSISNKELSEQRNHELSLTNQQILQSNQELLNSNQKLSQDFQDTKQYLVDSLAKTPIEVPNSSRTQTYTTFSSGGAVAGGSSDQKSESNVRNLTANFEGKSTTNGVSIGWVIDVKRLVLILKESEPSSASIISDTTREARDFAKHLETGLRIGGWTVAGDSFSDPEFFSGSLAIEVSSNPASANDHSSQEAKALLDILKTQFNIEGTLYQVDVKFPPDFMQIKVAGNRYN